MANRRTDGLRRYGHSKDHRDDLPQIVIGLAVTKEGIPAKCWVMPGNTSDMKTVQMVKNDLQGWKLGRCVWVMDRGMSSEQNRIILQQAGGQYIIGEKLRDHQQIHKEALATRGRFKVIRDNLQVKDVTIGNGERRRRFIVVYNPEEAKKDKATRDRILDKLKKALSELNGKDIREHKKCVCALVSHKTMGRYLRKLKDGQLRIDMAKVREEEHLDGKYLLSTSDDSLSAEDVALGYKQLLEVERAFRTLKTTLELRPIYHRKDERIQAHVFLRFLALLLVRIAERSCEMSWDHIRTTMDRLHVVELSSKDGSILQTTEASNEQVSILRKLKISLPKRIQTVHTNP